MLPVPVEADSFGGGVRPATTGTAAFLIVRGYTLRRLVPSGRNRFVAKGKPLSKHKPPSSHEQESEIHRGKKKVKMPAGVLFSPETGLLNEHFLLDRSEADQYEAERGKLQQDAGR